MNTTSTNSTSLKECSLRLDAGYHLSEGQLTLSTFKHFKIPTQSLSSLSERIFYGGRARRIYVKSPKNGLSFIKGADIIKADFSSLGYISRKRTANLDEYFLKEGWTVLTRSGTIGNTAFVNKDFIGKAASDDIIRVVPKSIPPGFLYAFLSSKYGRSLLTHGTYGAVIQHIEPEHIENIPVPIFPPDRQQQIHDLITQSAELRVEANRFLEEAIYEFESKIGLTSISLGRQNEIIKIESVKSFMSRLDSQFQIASKKLKLERKSNLVYRKISSLAKNISVGNRSKRIYVNNGIPFLSSSDMVLFNPKKYAKQISTRSANLDSVKVSLNDILISRSGTVGNVVIVGNDLENAAVSEHALRLVIDSSLIAPEYVFCYLKTMQGKLTMEASAFGSVIITLNEDLIGNIQVPILDELSMKEIISKIKLYINKMDRAILKEIQAIHLVEKEIDQWHN